MALSIIITWTTYLCYLKVQQQLWFKTGLDLAIYASVAWHMVHGPAFYDAILDMNTLGMHFSPIYAAIMPLYWAFEHPATLLVLQSIGLGAGVVAVYLIAVRRLGESVWTLAVLILVLSHSYLHIAHAKDFHTNMLAIPVLLWILYYVETGSAWRILLLAMAGLTVEEGVAPAIASVGLYLLAFRSDLRLAGFACLVIATLYFAVVVGVIIPTLYGEGGHIHWDRYAHLGPSMSEALTNLLTRPWWALHQVLFQDSKWFYLAAFFASVGFVPFLAWRQALLTVLPLLAMTLSQNPGQYKLGFHYSATVLPFLYYASVHGMEQARLLLQRLVPDAGLRAPLVCGTLVALAGFNVSQSPGYDLTRVDAAYVREVRQVLAEIPKEASVAANGALVAQLVNRHRVCYVGWEMARLCTWGAPEFVVLDLGGARYSETPVSVRSRYLASLTTLGYSIVHRRGEFVVLRGKERVGAGFAPSPMPRTF